MAHRVTIVHPELCRARCGGTDKTIVCKLSVRHSGNHSPKPRPKHWQLQK